ncbi:MAG TPA: TfoX/Sxy family protein [Bacteroidota bacterium]|nr:TfoX/Sxy family protein [Bacteroidota bacterium]
MPYDEHLVGRIRAALLPRRREVEEKKMMGGLTFMLKGKMCCGVIGDTLMVRVVDGKYSPSLAKPHCREMDFSGPTETGGGNDQAKTPTMIQSGSITLDHDVQT